MSKKITLACKECNNKNYRVHKTQDKRLEVKKFCKTCAKHTLHQEEK